MMGVCHLPVKLAPLRQLMRPLPYWAPTMNPAFLTDGRMMTQAAWFSRLWGMPLEALSSSRKTWADAVTLSFVAAASARALRVTEHRETARMQYTNFVNRRRAVWSNMKPP